MEPAAPSDAVSVEALLDEAALWQKSRGFQQWNAGQFREEVRSTMAGGYLFVARSDDRLAGCFMLDTQPPDRIARWLVEQGLPEEGAHLSRLAVARGLAGVGLGARLVDDARRLAGERGLAVLRLDCPADNARLCRYYLELGFSVLGDMRSRGPKGERWVGRVFEKPTG